MKILLSGPHYSGKTTLAETLRDNYGLVGTFESRPARAANKYFRTKPSDVPFGSREVFQNLAFVEQIILEEQNESVQLGTGDLTPIICDRTAVDFAAYTTDETIKASILLYAKETYKYDCHIFLVEPLGKDPVDDGKRFLTDPNKLFQEFINLYDMIDLEYHILKMGTINERISEIERITGLGGSK